LSLFIYFPLLKTLSVLHRRQKMGALQNYVLRRAPKIFVAGSFDAYKWRFPVYPSSRPQAIRLLGEGAVGFAD
jgi:hypothetical protein